jgi:uncharacterized protein
LYKMENQVLTTHKQSLETDLFSAMRNASKKIAPVWPLENFVAVNPYLGLTNQKFGTVAHKLTNIGGIRMTLPVSFYLEKIAQGFIMKSDLKLALSKNNKHEVDIDLFIRRLENSVDVDQNDPYIACFADTATMFTGKDWNRFVIGRISAWAASYFDNGQAEWNASAPTISPFVAWKSEAIVDLTPELSGLKGFRKVVHQFPDEPLAAAQMAIEMLEIPVNGLDTYLHKLLLKLGGWSAHAARLDWDNELYGGKDGKLIELLAILICWEASLYRTLNNTMLMRKWDVAKKRLTEEHLNPYQGRQLAEKLVLQDAFDIATQRTMIEQLRNTQVVCQSGTDMPKAQAIFCIDVRSEVFRRNLENQESGIETLGFAGFFAFPIQYIPIAHHKGEAQCPVLIKTGPTILERYSDQETNKNVYKRKVLKHEIGRAWKSFKSGAVTCFSFVSPMGLSYLPKLFTDSFGLTRPIQDSDNYHASGANKKLKTISLEAGIHNGEAVGIPMEQRVQMAKNALKAMSLTDNFAQFVLIVGHGSTTVNNPHATGLDCGACGGHTGEANAKVAAAVLNDREVRKQLRMEQINIPDHTTFLACMHDTTTDDVVVFNKHEIHSSGESAFKDVERALNKASKASRAERFLRMSSEGDANRNIKMRSKDWSQVRPEWGLAGCSAFIVAPRERTKRLDLGGRSFLHSYDWKKDQTFAVLELIMTAPMVVTSWINLQYFASTVDNKSFGSGNKTLHNITAGIGVLEGFSGDLRVGLPIQSIHDGIKYQHEPARLSVIIEAPLEAMNAILAKHQSVKDLCDNEWIYLLAMDEQGRVSHRYKENYRWESL